LVTLEPFAYAVHRFKKQARKIPGKGGQRYWKNVGLGFKTPKEAIEGEWRHL
jgi:hypothetical protein